MKPAGKAILLLLLAVTGLVGLATTLFIGVGALLAHWLPLSLFQASGLMIGATLTVVALIHGLAALMHSHQAHDDSDEFDDDEDQFDPAAPDSDPFSQEPTFSKVGRNDYCPCGSGKKSKHCCQNEATK